MNVEKLAPSIRRILAPNPSPWTLEGTNTYLLGERDPIVLDPGPLIESHLELILKEAGPISGVLLTHSHQDHAESAAALAERASAPLLDPEPLEVEGASLLPIPTPGHSSDHFCFLLEPGRILFSGDHVLGRGTTVVAHPDGSMSDYLRSLEEVTGLSPELILPGHGPTIEDPAPVLAFYKQHRLEREAKVIAALRASPGAVADLLPVVYADAAPEVMRAAELSLRAHLAKLAEDGIAVEDGAGWRLA